MLCALIMAGGKGTRFWPASTEKKPKQFLKLISEKTMIQETVDRLLPIIPIEQIFICTSEIYCDLVKEQLPKLPENNIIIEPMGKNTPPCILLSSLYIQQIHKDCKVVVVPADSAINDQENYLKTLKAADYFLDNLLEAIITIGITPNRPETGYGYIKTEKYVASYNDRKILKVEKFVEKPNRERAEFYISEGNYLWNAGMFVFNVEFMIQQFKDLASNIYDVLIHLPNSQNDNYQKMLQKLYSECEPISVDYAIMEKSHNIYVIPSEFGWDDVGSWGALERYMSIDNNNNIIKGNVFLNNCHDSIIYADDKTIIIDELKDIYCIQSGNHIVIGPKSKLNKVHEFRGR